MRSNLIDRIEALEAIPASGAEVMRMFEREGFTPAMLCEILRDGIAEMERGDPDSPSGTHGLTVREALERMRTALASMDAEQAAEDDARL